MKMISGTSGVRRFTAALMLPGGILGGCRGASTEDAKASRSAAPGQIATLVLAARAPRRRDLADGAV